MTDFDPALLDAVRDVLALTRCGLDDDEEGFRAVILAGVDPDDLTDRERRALDLVAAATGLLAELLHDHGGCGDWLASWQRRAGLG
jgi:hypothetical protein